MLRSYIAESEDDDVVQIFLDMVERDIIDIYHKFFKHPKNMIYGKKEPIERFRLMPYMR